MKQSPIIELLKHIPEKVRKFIFLLYLDFLEDKGGWRISKNGATPNLTSLHADFFVPSCRSG